MIWDGKRATRKRESEREDREQHLTALNELLHGKRLLNRYFAQKEFTKYKWLMAITGFLEPLMAAEIFPDKNANVDNAVDKNTSRKKKTGGWIREHQATRAHLALKHYTFMEWNQYVEYTSRSLFLIISMVSFKKQIGFDQLCLSIISYLLA